MGLNFSRPGMEVWEAIIVATGPLEKRMAELDDDELLMLLMLEWIFLYPTIPSDFTLPLLTEMSRRPHLRVAPKILEGEQQAALETAVTRIWKDLDRIREQMIRVAERTNELIEKVKAQEEWRPLKFDAQGKAYFADEEESE